MSDIPDDVFKEPPPLPDYMDDFQRHVEESVNKITGVMDSKIWGEGFTSGTNAAMLDNSTSVLTMDKLQESMNKIYSTLVETYERKPFSPGWPPLPFPHSGAFGVPVYTSKFMGDWVYPQPSAIKKGPYFRRRIKRWHRAHPPYTVGNGQYYIVNKDQIWCHPDDMRRLQATIDQLRARSEAST